jgi:hypothetical protein
MIEPQSARRVFLILSIFSQCSLRLCGPKDESRFSYYFLTCKDAVNLLQ